MQDEIQSMLKSPSFLAWANGDNNTETIPWSKKYEEDPEYRDLMDTARSMSLGYKFRAPELPAELIDAQWNKLVESQEKPKWTIKKWQKYAAIILPLIMIMAWQLVQTPTGDFITYTTNYGEQKTITLPDESQVRLNSNSSLTFEQTENSRKVKLTGEAWFEVAKDSLKPFTVDGQNAQIKVVGTSFNAISRPHSQMVSLLEGKVNYTIHGGKTVELKPGESAYADPKTGTISVYSDAVEDRITWMENIWTFDETPLRNIIVALKDNYNITTTVSDKKLLDRRITGKLSTDQTDLLYRALEVSLDIEITNVGHHSIVIKNAAHEE